MTATYWRGSVMFWGMCLFLVAVSVGQVSGGDRELTNTNTQDSPAGWPMSHGFGGEHGADSGEKSEAMASKTLWFYGMRGRGLPVAVRHNDGWRVYALGYAGEDAIQRDTLVCLDAVKGDLLWNQSLGQCFSPTGGDWIQRGSPAVDVDSGQVYWLTTSGMLAGISSSGKVLWQRSLVEELGWRIREQGNGIWPVVTQDFVIVYGITAGWGDEAAVGHRVFAFDKKTGELAWRVTVGVEETVAGDELQTNRNAVVAGPVVGMWADKQVVYIGMASGELAAVGVGNGRLYWKGKVASGGITDVVLAGEQHLLVVAKKEASNDSSMSAGQWVMVKLPAASGWAGENAAGELTSDAVVWTAETAGLSGRPVIAGERVYGIQAGQVIALEAASGEQVWQLPLGSAGGNLFKQNQLVQTDASGALLYAQGRLYLGTAEGLFYVIADQGNQAQILSQLQLNGAVYEQAVSAGEGRLLVMKAGGLICFKPAGTTETSSAEVVLNKSDAQSSVVAVKDHTSVGKPVLRGGVLQVIPAEVAMKGGRRQNFVVRELDEKTGQALGVVSKGLRWSRHVLPVSGTWMEMGGQFDEQGDLVVAEGAGFSCGAFRVSYGSLASVVRGRVLPELPYDIDFDDVGSKKGQGRTGDVSLLWIGAKDRFSVREFAGSKVLAKIGPVGARWDGLAFIGHVQTKNYTIESDVFMDGEAEELPEAGLINQKYIVAVEKAGKQLTARQHWGGRPLGTADCRVEAGQWYRLKVQVEQDKDKGNFGIGGVRGTIRAKIWRRSDSEPTGWMLNIKQARIHEQGSPGVYGYISDPIKGCLYWDHLSVTPNVAPTVGIVGER